MFEMNMTMIADGHTTIEHSLPVQKIYDDVDCNSGKGSGTAYTPTMVVTYGGPFGENYWYQAHAGVERADPVEMGPAPAARSRSRRPVMNPPEEDNPFPTRLRPAGSASSAFQFRSARTGSARASAPTGTCGPS